MVSFVRGSFIGYSTVILSVVCYAVMRREVLASTLILNVPERVDWKRCSASKEEETVAAKDMRTHFEPFDFTDDD